MRSTAAVARVAGKGDASRNCRQQRHDDHRHARLAGNAQPLAVGAGAVAQQRGAHGGNRLGQLCGAADIQAAAVNAGKRGVRAVFADGGRAHRQRLIRPAARLHRRPGVFGFISWRGGGSRQDDKLGHRQAIAAQLRQLPGFAAHCVGAGVQHGVVVDHPMGYVRYGVHARTSSPPRNNISMVSNSACSAGAWPVSQRSSAAR
jgi:hypothetical protein